MSAAEPQLDPLRAFLWGKRKSRRHAIDQRVEVRGAHGRVMAHAVDLSGNGVLLRVTLPDLVRARPDLPHGDSFALVITHLRGVFRIRFPEHNVGIRAELIRIAMEPDLPNEFLIGVRFRRPLSHKQIRRLGLSPKECGPETDGDLEPTAADPDDEVGA